METQKTTKQEDELIKLYNEIYKKTLAYELDRVKINDDGTTTHLHSDEFLDKHPERKDNPEFTKDEELEEIRYIASIAKSCINSKFE